MHNQMKVDMPNQASIQPFNSVLTETEKAMHADCMAASKKKVRHLLIETLSDLITACNIELFPAIIAFPILVAEVPRATISKH